MFLPVLAHFSVFRRLTYILSTLEEKTSYKSKKAQNRGYRVYFCKKLKFKQEIKNVNKFNKILFCLYRCD